MKCLDHSGFVFTATSRSLTLPSFRYLHPNQSDLGEGHYDAVVAFQQADGAAAVNDLMSRLRLTADTRGLRGGGFNERAEGGGLIRRSSPCRGACRPSSWSSTQPQRQSRSPRPPFSPHLPANRHNQPQPALAFFPNPPSTHPPPRTPTPTNPTSRPLPGARPRGAGGAGGRSR